MVTPNTAERSIDRARFPLIAPMPIVSEPRLMALPFENSAVLPSGMAMSLAWMP